jgi:competence protein ComEA
MQKYDLIIRKDAPTRQGVAGRNKINRRRNHGRMIRIIALAFGAVALATILAPAQSGASTQNPSSPSDADSLPDGPGKAIVVKACLACHDAKKVTSMRGTEDEWADEVNKMMARGAVLSDDEVDQVVEYLAAHFPPPDAKGGGAPEPAATPPPPEKSAVSPASSAPAPSLSNGSPATVNVNKAGVEDLKSSLGLSEADAKAIVEYREQHGNFKSWQDVASVPGIPPEKIKEKQKLITF